ncbi:hypothetical protein [Bradyrhizobium sp. CCGUVB23]|uniref:hypothetical protein n=1 Tax=Bradyrhizobium sp. CCGUVB23 TaxID=2949630 RepID=UPI0035326869
MDLSDDLVITAPSLVGRTMVWLFDLDVICPLLAAHWPLDAEAMTPTGIRLLVHQERNKSDAY